MNFSLFKSRKRGELTAVDDVVSGPRRRADVARRTSAWMQCGIEATWQSHGWPARGASGTDGSTRTSPRGRVHADEFTRTPVRGTTWHVRGSHMEGPWV